MKLITKELEERLNHFPLYSQDGKGLDSIIAVKYFNPFGNGTWLITEAEKQSDGDWLLFGYCHIFEWEWGYVTLSELESVGFIERDQHLSPDSTIKQVYKTTLL